MLVRPRAAFAVKKFSFFFRSFPLTCFLTAFLCGLLLGPARADDTPDPTALYRQLKAFSLGNDSIRAENVVLQKDRATITFHDGIFYFPAPVAGKVRGAVFIGSGSFKAQPPPSNFERENVHRALNSDGISLDFKTAVLRFTDDTYTALAQGSIQSLPPSPQAAKLASELDAKVLEETGANVSARQVISIVNAESPGFFFAEFDGSHKGRFTYLLDYQSRIPVASFALDAGERGLIYAFSKEIWQPDVWMAFYTEEDYQRGRARYSNIDDLIVIPNYEMDVDVTEPKKWLRMKVTLHCQAQGNQFSAIPFQVGEDLDYLNNERRKKQLHVVSANLPDGTALHWFQEAWEGGFTVLLPSPMHQGTEFEVQIALQGEFMFQSESVSETYFPLRTTTWFPRHGNLQRSVYDMRFRHRKRDVVASIGVVTRDEVVPDGKDQRLTEFKLPQPVALTSFSVGLYEIHKDEAKMPDGHVLPIEFYSMPGYKMAIKEDFIVAELNNCVRFFSQLFGPYPYPVFRGAFHPFGYGQGFPTTLMIPATDRAVHTTYQFIAHETSHQWWGDLVLWRSYRDQWLSEGFADYSGMLYTQTRDRTSSEKDLIKRAREELKMPPITTGGVGKGRVIDVGPLILGHRLATRQTENAYEALIYKKGALVLRMLHYLFTDPQTGDGRPFYEMMADFVHQHANGSASTEDFFAVANAHVGTTPLARKFGYQDLNWFYRQWVTETVLPSYRVNYQTELQPDHSVLLKGTIVQEGIPESEKWFMPVPLVITMGKGSRGMVAIAALGKETSFKIRLPSRPEKVELDPDLWILTDHTSVSEIH